jgi:hypothetical protein
MTKERWAPVPDYPGYEVSDHGRVRSLDREVQSRWGTPKVLKGKELSQNLVGGSGPGGRYWGTTLFRDGKRKPVLVHAVMLMAFIGPRPEGAHGCHRDDDPNNNTLKNLYWGSPKQNVGDSVKSGRHRSVFESAKEWCAQGHEYTPENTYIKPRTGHRDCRTCHREQSRQHQRRKRAKLS